jgi:hypothetical protein
VEYLDGATCFRFAPQPLTGKIRKSINSQIYQKVYLSFRFPCMLGQIPKKKVLYDEYFQAPAAEEWALELVSIGSSARRCGWT